MHEFLQHIIDWYLARIAEGGYPLIVLLMAIESSFLPLPSELVIPPAAITFQQRGAGFGGYAGIVLAGAIGSWIGAAVMYWGSRLLGRPLVMRYGKYFLAPPEKVEAAERWAEAYGSGGVFFSRLLPVVRHLIGIPFGIVRMNFVRYSIFTLIGSALWCTVLVFVGLQAGKDEALMRGDLHRITLWLAGAVVVLGGLYYAFVQRTIKNAR
ncbi:MAG TPA: DedA family protein [Nevskiaceae bacterium]|nr:DedA family protein [Nevskiaceae bacterium]